MYGTHMMNNTGCYPISDTELTKKTAQRISRMLHVVFVDRSRDKFQGEPVDDENIQGNLNETINSITAVGGVYAISRR